jgi:hypothetical protein
MDWAQKRKCPSQRPVPAVHGTSARIDATPPSRAPDAFRRGGEPLEGKWPYQLD